MSFGFELRARPVPALRLRESRNATVDRLPEGTVRSKERRSASATHRSTPRVTPGLGTGSSWRPGGWLMFGVKKQIARRLRAIRDKDDCLPSLEVHRCSKGVCHSAPVTTLEVGRKGVISCLTNPDHPRTARLASLGLVPGVQIQLTQRYPAFVLRIGYAEIALDEELAGLVRVLA